MNGRASCAILCLVISLVTPQLVVAETATPWGDQAAKFIYATCTQSSQTRTTLVATKVKDYCICVVRKSFESITQKQHQYGVEVFVASQHDKKAQIARDETMERLYNTSALYCKNFMHPSTTVHSKHRAGSFSSRASNSVYDFGAYIKQRCGPVSKSVKDHPCTIRASRYWLKHKGSEYDDIPYPYITANTLATSYLLGSSF